ncbi:hypothetical protein ILUMI_05584 [Ignelater luminosus]|uniref:Fucosyltransferase n=1 Tax=Ignelater luminosus TaxID=2038154 RepID=A0A8K0GHZ9_IGNLU|nr:hypothetical protein ILUMI_05584 [Ignelater luminosus]
MEKLFRKSFLVFTFLFVIMILILLIKNPSMDFRSYPTIIDKVRYFTVRESDYENNMEGMWRGLSNEQKGKLSKLGEILYLDHSLPKVDASRNYTFLIWKHGPSQEFRHIRHYTKQRFDPFEKCSVKNCYITYKDEDLEIADLVVFHLHRTRGVDELPTGPRNPQQIWTFLTDESPFHTFTYSRNNVLKNYDGLFNWSMSYRMDCDIPVPYGRTVALKMEEAAEEENFDTWNANKSQDVFVAIMGSNCGGRNNRWKYVKELQKYIQVDIYGHCGPLKCPGHFLVDCPKLSKYKFYLAFENSNCDEYITEKLWWNAYAKNAIPIVMGSPKHQYRQLLPPNSYISVDDFTAPKHLANYIIYLNNNPHEMKRYFKWKKYFKILNEHAYFQTNSVHYCRICEALNYNSKKNKVYTNLENFWNKYNNCYPAWDAELVGTA